MAIRTAESKILATVAAFGKVKDSQYGEGRKFQSVLFESDRLPDGQHWKSMSPDDARGFRKGQQVYLIPVRRDNRDTFDIEIPAHPNTHQHSQGKAPSHSAGPQPNTHQPLTDDQKKEVAAYCDEILALYTYAYKKAKEKLAPLGASEETVKCAASGAAISAQRRYGLAERVEFAPEPGTRNSAPQNTHSTVAPPTAQPGAQPRKRPGVTYSPPRMTPEKEAVAARVMAPAGATTWQGDDF